jgi:hypothetical protein
VQVGVCPGGLGQRDGLAEQAQRPVKAILADLPRAGWETRSAGVGSKGPRIYDWLRFSLSDPPPQGWWRWLLVRRRISDPREVTADSACGRARTTLADLVRVAGTRWTVEESIQTAKGEVGLDHYEVRSWTGWYRHMTLARIRQIALPARRLAASMHGTHPASMSFVWDHVKRCESAKFVFGPRPHCQASAA